MSGSAAHAAVVLTFVWLGMVLAISFLEAPLKFRAPGLELRVGLAIGRIVFRALNSVEVVLAAGVLIAVGVGHPTAGPLALAIAVAVLLAVQLTAVRPALTRRSNLVLSGADAPRSSAHHAYIGTEVLKVIGLVALGTLLF